MPLAKRLDQLRQWILACGGHGADPQGVWLEHRPLTGGEGALLEQARHIARLRRIGRGRGTQRAARPLGQFDPKLALEDRHCGRDRGLGHDELLSGGGDRPAAWHGQEGHELAKGYLQVLECKT
jgi:hypothetical protein